MTKNIDAEDRCHQCKRWKYNDRIERTYGMGTGICEADMEPKGCDRRACLLFIEKEMNGGE